VGGWREVEGRAWWSAGDDGGIQKKEPSIDARWEAWG
jgi:hypothetical protein